jgi:hypothetical protein
MTEMLEHDRATRLERFLNVFAEMRAGKARATVRLTLDRLGLPAVASIGSRRSRRMVSGSQSALDSIRPVCPFWHARLARKWPASCVNGRAMKLCDANLLRFRSRVE